MYLISNEKNLMLIVENLIGFKVTSDVENILSDDRIAIEAITSAGESEFIELYSNPDEDQCKKVFDRLQWEIINSDENYIILEEIIKEIEEEEQEEDPKEEEK